MKTKELPFPKPTIEKREAFYILAKITYVREYFDYIDDEWEPCHYRGANKQYKTEEHIVGFARSQHDVNEVVAQLKIKEYAKQSGNFQFEKAELTIVPTIMFEVFS